MTGVDRKTIRRIAREIASVEANSPGVATGSEGRESAVCAEQNTPPRPLAPKVARSAWEAHRAWIEGQVQLGRNAQAIYQDLVERFAFTHRYNSVKRFVRTLRRRDPERFDVLESEPGEEAQVDLGLGAPTLYRPGKYRRPLLYLGQFREILDRTPAFRSHLLGKRCMVGEERRQPQSLGAPAALPRGRQQTLLQGRALVPELLRRLLRRSAHRHRPPVHRAAENPGLDGSGGIEPPRRRAIHLRHECRSFPRIW
jgi:hypothetical protein